MDNVKRDLGDNYMANVLNPQRLKSAREKEGISMTEAARRLNLSKIGYCRYEYGDRVPSPQTVEVIAQCLHTSVDYLVGLSDNPEQKKIMVDKEEEPDLFALVEMCHNLGDGKTKRLLEYLRGYKDGV